MQFRPDFMDLVCIFVFGGGCLLCGNTSKALLSGTWNLNS